MGMRRSSARELAESHCSLNGRDGAVGRAAGQAGEGVDATGHTAAWTRGTGRAGAGAVWLTSIACPKSSNEPHDGLSQAGLLDHSCAPYDATAASSSDGSIALSHDPPTASGAASGGGSGGGAGSEPACAAASAPQVV